MAFYTCNRYRLIVLIMLALIMWQSFRLFLVDKPKPHVIEDSSLNILRLEDDKYNIHKQDKIKIRVYYEALCPDSKHFFIRHLWPVTEKLSDFIEVFLVPYGKASTKEENGHYFFQCQHGEQECYANKVHACAIDVLNNPIMAVKLAQCMITDNMDADEALARCAKPMNVDPEPITNCALSAHGSALLKKHGDDTEMIKPTFIPTITMNGSKDNQPAILKNFLLEVCKMIDIPLPPPCL
ncbi:unnamed protein product [Danaus chrysippus]|uniref:(African queen) hypothetical protein n=1 Tax=Danaus chrysippus TaxID=151541 RepID=A0A8J2VW20_9NEOP|nr:unnamed protein product [Danaus chrysippus]